MLIYLKETFWNNLSMNIQFLSFKSCYNFVPYNIKNGEKLLARIPTKFNWEKRMIIFP